MSTLRRLAAVLQHLAPDLATELWRVGDVRELPHEVRGAIADVLGHECAAHGLGRDDELPQYGRELEALIEGLGLDG